MKALTWILQLIGSAVYGTIVAYLLWLIFYWLTPYMMTVGWSGYFLYLTTGAGIIYGLIISAMSFLSIPTIYLTKGNIVAKVIMTLPFLAFSWEAIAMPWMGNIEYGFLQWIIAISLSINITIMFISMAIIPFKIDE